MKHNVQKKYNLNQGYAILFAVVVVSIISMLAIGLSNTTYKQLVLSSLANDSQISYFQSDTSTECALYADNVLLMTPLSASPWRCGKDNNGADFTFNISGSGSDYSLSPTVLGTAIPCFDFNVTKSPASPFTTTIYARGYNSCVKTNPKTVEREIEVTYDGTGSGPIVLGNSASFVGIDTDTIGNWQGRYGSTAYTVMGSSQSYPSSITVTPSGNSLYVWESNPKDDRAPYIDSSSADRIAATWYAASSYTIDIDITDGSSHQVALYMLDWDSYGPRSANVQVLDGDTSAVLDSQDLDEYAGGKYLIWTVSGHVVLNITNNAKVASNVTASGIFFD